jgi:hypothetical protein
VRRRLLIVVALPLAFVLALVMILGGGAKCDPAGGDPGQLSPQAREDIPADIARIYIAQAARWDIDVAFLASIGAQETDHGRNPAANEVNPSGCQGLMQLGVGGACGDFWGRTNCDGNEDGRMRILDPWDNICAAARGLRGEKGAPPAGGSEQGYHQAACNYYGACADGAANYASEVMARAHRYGFVPGKATDPGDLGQLVSDTSSEACTSDTPIVAGDGPVVIDPGANRPGVPLSPDITAFVARMAELLPTPLIVTTGTNHSQYTTSGNISDHWAGNAVDFGAVRNGFPTTGGGYGDQIAEAAFLVAGEPQASARTKALKGGAYTITRAGLRIQIIWKSYVGGNHYDHIHVGLKRINTAT